VFSREKNHIFALVVLSQEVVAQAKISSFSSSILPFAMKGIL